jgi:F5/8 type C domain/Bacterial alpha-L-rhamnosidase 6 hairpin glycosidase domain
MRLLAGLTLAGTACARQAAPILDREAVLERYDWWDNRDWDWYAEKIPFFESPDPLLDATYYYRWEVLTKHLTYGSPETGYTFTEFIDRPFWSGAYGAISCPLGHQHYEVRWLKDRRIIDDFARYWFETPGAEPRSYSNWYGDAMWATYLALGDTAFLRAVFPHMLSQYAGWTDERWDSAHGMFRWDGMHDGMEFNINSRLTSDHDRGAEGYRPTLNSYLYADARAIAQAAALLGEPGVASQYAERAAALKRRVQEELWDPEREFFFHQSANDERGGIAAKSLTYETGPFAGNPHGRELIGYVPWQFGLPDPGYEAAWKFLMDTAYFAAPFGPTTVERGDPQFQVSPRCCVWSGNSWPYATTQTLVALANLLNGYEQNYVDADDYVALLRTYARTHRGDGRPYIAEAADPLTGSWAGHDTFYHSEHYFHSAYVDLIVTGLVGLRPRADDSLVVNPLAPADWDYFALDDVAYHGHTVSIVWDRDGTRYNRGRGLTLFVNRRRVANRPDLGPVSARIPSFPSLPSLPSPLHNWAVNNGGAAFPLATASYSAPLHPPFYAVDGGIWYHRSPPNRWTAEGSVNATDWFEVDFGVERSVETVKLYFLDDTGRADLLAEGGSSVVGDSAPAGLRSGDQQTTVRPPADYRLEAWVEGEWREIPGQRRRPPAPEGRRANAVSFDEIIASRVRVVLTHRDGSASGVTEFEAWGRGALPAPPATPEPANLAFSATLTASYVSSTSALDEIRDSRIAFTRYARNGWTALGSPNARDWIEVRFGAARRVGGVDLYLLGNRPGVAAPTSYRVEHWVDDAGWREAITRSRAPEMPTAWARNRVAIEPVTTSRLRVVFEHARPDVTGAAEVFVWEQ